MHLTKFLYYIYLYKHWAAEFGAQILFSQEREVVILPGFDDPVVAARL